MAATTRIGDLMTITQLAAAWGVDLSVASRRIKRSGIAPVATVGRAKLYGMDVARSLATQKTAARPKPRRRRREV